MEGAVLLLLQLLGDIQEDQSPGDLLDLPGQGTRWEQKINTFSDKCTGSFNPPASVFNNFEFAPWLLVCFQEEKARSRFYLWKHSGGWKYTDWNRFAPGQWAGETD